MAIMDTVVIKGFDRFTLNARQLINTGYEFAKLSKTGLYEPIHLFYAILNDRDNVVHEILNKVGIDTVRTIEQIKLKVNEAQSSKRTVNPKFSDQLKDLINYSFKIAAELNHVYIGSEHLILAFFKVKNIDFVKDLERLGVTYANLTEIIKNLSSQVNELRKQVKKSSNSSPKQESSLPFFCTDMNKKSREGKFSNITGRDEEISRLIHILSRKTKNNPILVGDAGVGKTAIVEGLVNRINSRDIPSSFFEKRVLSLDIASILSGARLRGDVEERITAVIEDAIDDGNTIVFIDEIHTIVGAGSVGGKDSLDIANLLKPYLTGSELSVIGATTNDEYNKYFETDSALARRFQPIRVNELDLESAKEVIYNLKDEFENYHKIKIQKDAIDQAVELSKKFIQDRYLPDKAIDLIDEAAATLKIGREVAIEPELSNLGTKLIAIQEKKNAAIREGKLELASSYRDKEEEVIDQIGQTIEGKKPVKKKYAKTVTPAIIKDIIFRWTEIPIVASDISDKTLKDLATNLKRRIVGQNHVIENSSLIIQKSHLGLNDQKRPLGSFLFLGPTGVGKTELAKMLAKELFGSADLIYQINMSEFMEMHSSAKLIGSPPGYVGFQEGGQLTKFVRRKPYSVILFDELEKAHPDTLNLLLQILEEGELTDSKGVKVSFKNTIIIMTSNIGAETVSNDNRLGFEVNIDQDKEIDIAYEEMKEKILETLKKSVRPEFLNRIDLIDVFRGLNKKDTLEIARLQVEELIVRLIESGIILEVDDSVVELINEQGFSKEFGGRNIRRKTQEILENGLTEFLLSNKVKRKKNSVIKVSVKVQDSKAVFSPGLN